LLFVGAQKGRRFALPNSRFLLHQPSTQLFGQASDMEISAKEILRTRRRYVEVLSREIGTPPDKIEADSNRDFWLSAEECQKYGLADKIVTNRSEIQ
ncbi:MAG: ATP-dependent Clp protease proteolytic subunit, partial [Planctomycetota bacterium]|nr:ATP-dependent Clp protease proteolytic subunit [Planctomycetota bacterium]